MNARSPISTLPAIVAVLSVSDAGPGGGATCPHCGAEGRYVNTFLCDDGTERGAMAGCFQLFPKACGPVARLTRTAIEREAAARSEGKRLAGWWQEIIDATAALRRKEIDKAQHALLVGAAEGRRRVWLDRNGYGKFRSRR